MSKFEHKEDKFLKIFRESKESDFVRFDEKTDYQAFTSIF
jgi:hypothetical protein